jgi:selenocysteine-specific elongation factor
MGELQGHLRAAAVRAPDRAAEGGLRLAVDRSFSLKGAGTVVTGTVFAGRVRVGDELVATPGGQRVRLRGLHVMNRPAREGRAGERCALNLAGAEKEEIKRGDWICTPRLHAPTHRFDAWLKLSMHAPHPLKHWAPVHLHLGAAHVMARIALLDAERLEPGASGLVQVVADEALAALYGDGFILRDAAARHTLGGGRVLDPWGPARRRKTAERLAELAALQAHDPADRLARLLHAAAWGLDLGRLSVAWNRADLAGLLPGTAQAIAVAGQDLAFAASRWQALTEGLLESLTGFHDRFPDERGTDAARARRMFLPKLPAAAFAELVDESIRSGQLQRTGPWLHRPEHRVRLTPEEQSRYERILPWLGEAPHDPPWVRDLARRSGVKEERMRQLMRKLARQGEVFQVVRDLFYTPAAVASLARMARELALADGEIRAAAFRDRSGIGRKRCIQILEFFDRVGYTRRVGEAHRLRNPELFEAQEKTAAAA